MQARHNENGVIVDSREYAAGMLIGMLGAFDQTTSFTLQQAVNDGVADQQLVYTSSNENVGYHWMHEYHQTHGDFGTLLFSNY